ncbi:MAG: hypothetical protein ACI9KE_005500, partial [Polyangiales bacterium]
RTGALHEAKWANELGGQTPGGRPSRCTSRDGGVDVDATGFGKCARTGALHEAKWANELGGQTPGGRPSRCTSAADAP